MSVSVEQALERLGTLEEVLQRNGHTVRRGMARCVSGLHEDNTASMHIYPGRNGKQLAYCHACAFRGDAIDVARALGERVELRGEKNERPNPAKPRPKPIPAQRELTRLLERRESIGFEVAAALTLARIHRDAARRDVELNRLWLEEQGSLDLIIELADRMRTWLLERYGIPAGFVWPAATVWAGFEELGSDGAT